MSEDRCQDCGQQSCVCFDYDDNDCWNCSGEGFVSNCFEEWACMHPDEGCDLCTRLCDVCQPNKPNPELQAVLAEALTATKEPTA